MTLQAFVLMQRGASERALKTLRTKTEKLERLCRALQTERNSLRTEIKKVCGGRNNEWNAMQFL